MLLLAWLLAPTECVLAHCFHKADRDCAASWWLSCWIGRSKLAKPKLLANVSPLASAPSLTKQLGKVARTEYKEVPKQVLGA